MLNNELRKLEKRIDKLEQDRKKKENDKGTKIFLDFNSDGENDPENIYLLATIPPRSQWVGHYR